MRVFIFSPGISILQNPSEESAEITTLKKIEEKFGQFSESDTCYIIATNHPKTKKALNLLKEEIRKNFPLKIEIDIVEGLNIESINDSTFLKEVNNFLGKISERISIFQEKGAEIYIITTTGYKIISNLLALLALLHNFTTLYVFKEAKEILSLPKLNIRIGLNIWKKYFLIFYYLSKSHIKSIGDIYKILNSKELPNELKPFIQVEGKYVITSLGKILLQQAINEYSEEKLKIEGLWKRKFIEDCFIRNIDRNRAVGCLVLDLDKFKSINDTYGHEAGDQVLFQMAQKVIQFLEKLNPDDYYFPPQFIRWGGEEFIILFQPKRNQIAEKQTRELAENIRQLIEKTDFRIKTKNGNVLLNKTVSIGATTGLLQSEEDFNSLFNFVDKLLYTAKEKGRNRVKFAVFNLNR